MPYDQELRKFLAPELIFGVGARSLAAQYAENLGLRKLLFVSDAGLAKTQWFADVRSTLDAHAISYSVFLGVTSNPKDYEVRAGLAQYRADGCNGILALGGGSPMDCAKGIGIMAHNEGDILSFEGIDTISASCPPLICIPTTAGSSADVSQFCIITDTIRKVKIAIVSKALVPDIALIDPETTLTMEPDLTAHTGLDALTHACEALVSNASSPLTDLHALESARLSFEHLARATQEPQNLAAREGMSLASLHAGLAFSNASLGAVHAMAHALGGLSDLPHGECNAILLPLVVAFNYSAAGAKYDRLLAALESKEVLARPPDECLAVLLKRIEALQNAVNVSERLGDLGVTQENLPVLADLAAKDPCMLTNPRDAEPSDLEALYARAL